ncbi:MAG: hypothetical protein V7631_4017 [Massilia sp.]|jgi:hypothetical protein
MTYQRLASPVRPRAGKGMLVERRAQDGGIDMAGLPAVAGVGELDGLCRQVAVANSSLNEVQFSRFSAHNVRVF